MGVESRTSSPLRIPRETEKMMHPEIVGLYPCGEGAGYAGGIEKKIALLELEHTDMSGFFIPKKGTAL